jgi:hypothetical protein
MKTKNNQQQSPSMVEDKVTEELKKRLLDIGLIVNAGADQKHGTIASQTKTTRKLDRTVRRAAEDQMAGKKGKR